MDGNYRLKPLLNKTLSTDKVYKIAHEKGKGGMT